MWWGAGRRDIAAGSRQLSRRRLSCGLHFESCEIGDIRAEWVLRTEHESERAPRASVRAHQGSLAGPSRDAAHLPRLQAPALRLLIGADRPRRLNVARQAFDSVTLGRLGTKATSTSVCVGLDALRATDLRKLGNRDTRCGGGLDSQRRMVLRTNHRKS